MKTKIGMEVKQQFEAMKLKIEKSGQNGGSLTIQRHEKFKVIDYKTRHYPSGAKLSVGESSR